jgi:hypothetical protein
MGYYMGDFYAGARGDPGFLSAFGRLAKGAVSLIPGFGPTAEKILTAGGKLLRHKGVQAAGGAVLSGAAGAATEHLIARPVGLPLQMGSRPGMGMGIPQVMAPGPGMRGFHMSKPRRGVAPHMVRNRHMRVTNPKALRRAIRRAHGFARLAKKVIHFTSPRPPKGRAIFKRKRKRT